VLLLFVAHELPVLVFISQLCLMCDIVRYRRQTDTTLSYHVGISAIVMVAKNHVFLPVGPITRHISETVRDRGLVTIDHILETTF